jgi:hypothetical protein
MHALEQAVLLQQLPDGRIMPLKVRSLAGLMPLLAVETLEHELVESLPVFKRRLNWFFQNRLFLRNDSGERPIYGGRRIFQDDRHWRDYLLFKEYFHGDNGAGLGAGHQTGWTGLVAKLMQQSGGRRHNAVSGI